MQLECFALSDVGPVRTHNEDACAFDERARLFAVFDGMGGQSSGTVAAGLATIELRAFVDEHRPAPTTHAQLERDARALVARIHDSIRRSAAPSPPPYGTTAAILSLSLHEALVAHVGDTRAYRLRGGALERLTTDHTLVEDVRRSGAVVDGLEMQEFEQRYGNVLTRCLGYGNELAVDTRLEELSAGDAFLLCTDGLSRALDERVIATILRDASSAESACRALVRRAIDAGTSDNVTALVVRVHR
ncbi:MAG: protein phosphatase 2C domain-containing protein [Polyangiales bacterium]